MLTIRHAILHAFDFDTGECYLSEHELDMDEKLVKSYVRRHLRRCVVSEQNMHGDFAESSNFLEEMHLYLAHQTSFLELSKQIATFFWETLRKCDDLVQADLLVADFEETESKPDAGDEEEIEASFDGEAKRRFAIILLPRSQNFMHSIEHPSGGAFNEIVRHDATLPNPSNKVDTYALIDCKDLTINFRDKARTIAEAEVWVIPNMLLQCSKEPSSHEVIKTMEQIVEEIVEAAPTNISMNTVEALSRTKAMVAHSAELDERVVPQDIGRQVFKDEPQLIERYEAAAEVHELPEEISVRRAAARRLTKTHRIRTDTGIDIAFPSDYTADEKYLRFERQEDGSISIIISNVQSIENR